MNAPLPDHIRRAIETVTLDDKYALDRGRAFMSGVQALVRLPMLQRAADALRGLNTAGFVSGYRGSPLGGYDQALWAARKHLEKNHVVFKPGVNEELGATAVWGTQQLDLYPDKQKYDGVFGIWYGKGPGVDRCIDVFKHANMAGTAKHGGVIAIAGDDHIAKSSTAAHQSDHVFKAVGFPVFFPTTVQDILDMGQHAIAMSRYSGLWSGMKTIQEIVESGATVDVSPDRVKIITPDDFQMPAGGLHIRWPDPPLDQEARMMDYKWYAALAYVRANKLNHNVIEGPNGGKDDRFGIIASGKAYNDTRQALHDLGLDDATCRRLGIRLHKVNVVWPLEATITRDFATGLKEILVIEEKRQIIEYQIKEELYNWRPDVRPNVMGKFEESEGDMSGGEWNRPNPTDRWLLRAQADLTPAIIARAITKRLKKLGVDSDVMARLDARMAVIEAKERALTDELKVAGEAERTPWFCSGCPHNTSTRVPEGSRAVAGIGCHYMVSWMPGRNTSTFTQMGGEGVPWVGQSAFTTEKHIFTNLGDGTYFHSGSLAIRQSIAAGVNITYKILYNDAVAMTGGQQVGERPEGHSVLQIMNSVISEGVAKLIIVSDQPEKYTGVALAPGVTVHHRDELDALQRQFREIPGTTAIIYDQTCATEKRRRRKRGKMVEPEKRVVINELVCEGCGDCGVQSNCMSIEPLETDFGRKRQINQNSCNKDYSCVKGFCPSFVTVEGGQMKKAKAKKASPFDNAALGELPHPTLPVCDAAWGIVVAGVGGTGVITIGQLLGMAAHLEGKGVVTQDAAGLAQKGGSTWSHIQIANTQEAIHCTKVGTAEADLIIGCDAIVAANKATLQVMRPGRTFVALNTHKSPTATFVINADWQHPGSACETALEQAVGKELLGKFDAEEVAVKLLGDSIYTNPLMMGFAWQHGRIPLSFAAIQRAIELNGVQIDNNKAAFEWGRRCAHDYAKVRALFAAQSVISIVKRPGVDEMVAKRVEFLTGYQNAAYAADYKAFVEKVRAAEEKLGKGTTLTEAVAKYLFKLMAYKDEYEVARLHTDKSFTDKIAAQFEGDYKLVHHLAPPLLAKKNVKGELVKQQMGAWVRPAFGVLAKLKGLRGTALDIFGYTEERKMERALIDQYRATVDELLGKLSSERLAQAVELARIPEDIRGYGHVKERHAKAAQLKWQQLLAAWRA
jgi:indolepyruvate ferredoxin oxidoreductase